MDSLAQANKAKFYKRAEMKVAMLQRRMKGLLYELGVNERGWAEQTDRQMEDVHEKMLEGVMRK